MASGLIGQAGSSDPNARRKQVGRPDHSRPTLTGVKPLAPGSPSPITRRHAPWTVHKGTDPDGGCRPVPLHEADDRSRTRKHPERRMGEREPDRTPGLDPTRPGAADRGGGGRGPRLDEGFRRRAPHHPGSRLARSRLLGGAAWPGAGAPARGPVAVPQVPEVGRVAMKKAAEYRGHAKECRSLAERTPPGDQRDQLIEMARTWDALAAERDRLAHRAREDSSRMAEPARGRGEDD